jgi:hypothetical protein
MTNNARQPVRLAGYTKSNYVRGLEQSHPDAFVAIEPISGDCFLSRGDIERCRNERRRDDRREARAPSVRGAGNARRDQPKLEVMANVGDIHCWVLDCSSARSFE